MRYGHLIIVVLLLTGCDKRIVTEQRVTGTRTVKIGCTYYGYCYGMGYDGKWGIKLNAYCPGHRLAEVEVTQVSGYWEKSNKDFSYESFKTIKTLEACN